MTARIIDGKLIASKVEAEVRQGIARLAGRLKRPPHLAVVLVGEDEGSKVYVRRKAEACLRVGIESQTHGLPTTASAPDVERVLRDLAGSATVDAILLQLPLPPGLDADRLTSLIPAHKDVDCFHPENVGLVALGRGRLRPCTAQGVLEILDHEKTPLQGAEVVIVNHSNIVGRPLAELLLHRNASVSVCHEFTKDLAAHTRRADVLVTATGVAGLIGPGHVKPGATVIDVGIARKRDGGITGDVQFDEVKAIAGALTPVPGGVGPLTVAMLLRNVAVLAEARLGRDGGAG